MGLSIVSGGAAALTAATAYSLRYHLPSPALIALVHAAVTGFLVSFSSSDYLCERSPHVFGKNPSGKLPLGVRVVAWPFFSVLHLRLALRRKRSKEPLIQQIRNGWYIGGWPNCQAQLPQEPLGVIDCTNEYQRTFSSDIAYLSLPTWDTQGVSTSNVKRAVEFALAQRRLGRAVLVHCAHGHGRSAQVLLACMIIAGEVNDIDSGLKLVQSVRPKVKLNAKQRRNLEKYMARVVR